MDLLYKSSFVDIFFDAEKNMLVQKWKDKEADMELIYGPRCKQGLDYNLKEITTTQLYDCPTEDFESELQIMLFQFYPTLLPEA